LRLVVVDSLDPTGPSRADRQPLADSRLACWLSRLARDTHKPVLALYHTPYRRVDRAIDRRPLAGPLRMSHLRVSHLRASAAVILSLDAPDPARPHLKRLAVVKSSLAAPPPPLGLYLTSPGGAVCGDTDAAGAQIRFCDPPHPPQAASLLDQAIELLRDLLARGPLPATLVQQQLARSGISQRTTRRAKLQLGVRSARQDGRWHWILPAAPTDRPALKAPPPQSTR
jgi:hypothetical protein